MFRMSADSVWIDFNQLEKIGKKMYKIMNIQFSEHICGPYRRWGLSLDSNVY